MNAPPKPPRRRVARPEEALQRELVALLRRQLPKPWLVLHVPNGGGRSKAEAGVLKAMGVLAGFPDLLVIGPNAKVVAIELKRPPRRLRDGTLSKASPRLDPAQRAILADLAACKIATLIVTDITGALTALQALGVPVRGRVM